MLVVIVFEVPASAHKEVHQRNTPLKVLKVSPANETRVPLTVMVPKQTAYKKSSRLLKGKYNTTFFSEAKILQGILKLLPVT